MEQCKYIYNMVTLLLKTTAIAGKVYLCGSYGYTLVDLACSFRSNDHNCVINMVYRILCMMSYKQI